MKLEFHLVAKIILTALIISFLHSCKKADDIVNPGPGPGPGPGPVSRSFQLELDSIPGELPGAAATLFAVITVENEQGQPVLSNKKLSLSHQTKFISQSTELPSGSYKLTRLMIVDQTDKVKFISPLTSSVKAALVTRPLPTGFSLPQPQVRKVPADVLRIQAGDKPADYGYPVGTFDTASDENPPAEPAFVNIRFRTSLQVGQILYDSIPSFVVHMSWDENNQYSVRYLTLAPGTQNITLSTSAVKHTFKLNKWGKQFELSLLKNQLKADSLYKLEGTMEARKIQSELTYRLEGEKYVPVSKTDYKYENGEKLSEINYYLRREDNSPYLAGKEEYFYVGDKIDKISYLDENNHGTGYLRFERSLSGKISKMVEWKNNTETRVEVSYNYTPATQIRELTMHYSYSNSTNGFHYYQRLRDGNKFSDNSNTDNYSFETGDYQYDMQINPYAHMGVYDLFLSHGSKNNVTAQAKTYTGSYPEAVLYSYSYTYDANGYPTEVIKKYKSYLTGLHKYTTKTVFVY